MSATQDDTEWPDAVITPTPAPKAAAVAATATPRSPVPPPVPASDDRLPPEKEKKAARLSAPVLNGHGNKVVADEFARKPAAVAPVPKKPVAPVVVASEADTKHEADLEKKAPATATTTTNGHGKAKTAPSPAPSVVNKRRSRSRSRSPSPSAPAQKKVAGSPAPKPGKRPRSPASSPVKRAASRSVSPVPIKKAKKKAVVVSDAEEEEEEDAPMPPPREEIHATQEMPEEPIEANDVEAEEAAEAEAAAVAAAEKAKAKAKAAVKAKPKVEAKKPAAPVETTKPRSRLVKPSEQPTKARVRRPIQEDEEEEQEAEAADDAAEAEEEEDEEAPEEEEEIPATPDSPIRKVAYQRKKKLATRLVDAEDVRRISKADLDFLASDEEADPITDEDEEEDTRHHRRRKSKSKKTEHRQSSARKKKSAFVEDEAEEVDDHEAQGEDDANVSEPDDEDTEAAEAAIAEEEEEEEKLKEEAERDMEVRRAALHPILRKKPEGREVCVLVPGTPLAFRCNTCRDKRTFSEVCATCKTNASGLIEKDKLDARIVSHVLFFDGLKKCTFTTRPFLVDRHGKRLKLTKPMGKELLLNTEQLVKEQKGKPVVNWATLSATANRHMVALGTMKVPAPIVDDSAFLSGERGKKFAPIIDSFNESVANAYLNQAKQWTRTEEQARILQGGLAATANGKKRGGKASAASAATATSAATEKAAGLKPLDANDYGKATPEAWNMLSNRFNDAIKACAHFLTAPNVADQALFESFSQMTNVLLTMSQGPEGMQTVAMEYSSRSTTVFGAAFALLLHQRHPVSLSRQFPPKSLPPACDCKGPCDGSCETKPKAKPVAAPAPVLTPFSTAPFPRGAKPVTASAKAKSTPAKEEAPRRSGKTERESDFSPEELEVAELFDEPPRHLKAPVAAPSNPFQRPMAPTTYFNTKKATQSADAYGDDDDQLMAEMAMPEPTPRARPGSVAAASASASASGFKRPVGKLATRK